MSCRCDGCGTIRDDVTKAAGQAFRTWQTPIPPRQKGAGSLYEMKSSVYIAVADGNMLKDTISKFFKVDSLLSNLTGYVETRVELLKIELKEDLAKGLAKAVSYFLIAFVSALFLTFISIAAAIVIGDRLGYFAGFAIVAGVYLLTALILWLSRAKVISGLEARFAVMFRKKQ